MNCKRFSTQYGMTAVTIHSQTVTKQGDAFGHPLRHFCALLSFRLIRSGTVNYFNGVRHHKESVKVPELMTIFREVADVQTADMLALDVPNVRGGKLEIIVSEPDWYVKTVMEDFVKRAERIRGGAVDPSEDNFLKITHDARLLGTDPRLLDTDAPNNPDGKLNKVAENVYKEYELANDSNHIGCQLVFSDIGVPGKDKAFTVYEYLKERLIELGIPEPEIAFVHDANTDAQREQLFKAVRTGKKKILIGSTEKCGTGVNVQTHLVALHHVDCPWKPSEIEQREGRGIRQGNENDEIAVYRYVTKSTFDAYMWGIIENKQHFISQVMTGHIVGRTCDDIDETCLQFAEIKAIATGTPLIKEKMEVDNEVQRLRVLKASFDSQRYSLQDNFMIKYPKLVAAAAEKLECVREDLKVRDAQLVKNPDFVMKVGGITFTERVDAGTQLLKEICKAENGETTLLGKYKGFDVLVEKNYINVDYLILKGKTVYKAETSTSPVGMIAKMEHLFSNMEDQVKKLEVVRDKYERDLQASKSQYVQPFEHEERLAQLLKRQAELNVKLDLEHGTPKQNEEKEKSGQKTETSLNAPCR